MIARVTAGLVFVVWLNGIAASGSGLITPFVWFAGIDGVLSLLMAGFGLGIPGLRGWFVLVSALDGLWLLAAAMAVGPGVRTPDLVLTLLLYVALSAVCVLSFGLLMLAEARRRGRTSSRHALRVALSIAAIASALFGVGAYFMRSNPELVRRMLMAAAAVESLALLAVAVRQVLPNASSAASVATDPAH